MKLRLFIFCVFLTRISFAQVYTTVNSHADFLSDAPLEVIKASSEQIQGVLDVDKNNFAFKIYIRSFDGFNNPLQKIHFYENYMEANEYPIATFKGKILEKITKEKKTYRAKGTLSIHGVETNRIISVELTLKDKALDFSSNFEVNLNDHDIELPRIVYQKIAEDILVHVSGTMYLKE